MMSGMWGSPCAATKPCVHKVTNPQTSHFLAQFLRAFISPSVGWGDSSGPMLQKEPGCGQELGLRLNPALAVGV